MKILGKQIRIVKNNLKKLKIRGGGQSLLSDNFLTKNEKTGRIALHLSVNMDCSVEFA